MSDEREAGGTDFMHSASAVQENRECGKEMKVSERRKVSEVNCDKKVRAEKRIRREK